LNKSNYKIIGAMPGGPAKKKIFNLPTANGANKTLKAWIGRAGINKITAASAAHCGTNLILTMLMF
jgi:hypothetical protein